MYHPEDWRLPVFIDSSKRSLKCVLLHSGNKYASVPIAHSTTLKEKYEAIKYVLEKISYDQHEWLICADLKMVNFLLGQQSGFTKYPCFLYMWDSRDQAQHYAKRDWPARNNLEPSRLQTLDSRATNIINKPLVDREKTLYPPLHIKLGLMKQYTKALDQWFLTWALPPPMGHCWLLEGRKYLGWTLQGALYSEGVTIFTSLQICFSSSAISRSMYTRALYRSTSPMVTA